MPGQALGSLKGFQDFRDLHLGREIPWLSLQPPLAPGDSSICSEVFLVSHRPAAVSGLWPPLVLCVWLLGSPWLCFRPTSPEFHSTGVLEAQARLCIPCRRSSWLHICDTNHSLQEQKPLRKCYFRPCWPRRAFPRAGCECQHSPQPLLTSPLPPLCRQRPASTAGSFGKCTTSSRPSRNPTKAS